MHLSKKSLGKTRKILLDITPEITGIMDELAKLSKTRVNPGEISEEEAAIKGIEMAKDVIDMLVVRQYDGIVKILCALYETKRTDLESKELGEIVEMIEETLQDQMLMRFFPRLRLLKQKTQSAT